MNVTYTAAIELGGAKPPILDAEKLHVLGQVAGRGPTYATLDGHEYTVREQPAYRADDVPPPGVTLFGRTITERGSDGRPMRRRQVIEATEVPVGTHERRSRQHEKRQARLASEQARSATPRYVDLLAGLSALQGRQPSIIPLSPMLPAEEKMGRVIDLPGRKAATIVVKEEAPRRGIDGAWDYLTAGRGIGFGLSKSGRLALPATHIAFGDREVIEALGEDVIVALLNARGIPRCDLPHKGTAPVAFTVAWPNRLPICEDHLNGVAE